MLAFLRLRSLLVVPIPHKRSRVTRSSGAFDGTITHSREFPSDPDSLGGAA